MKKFYDAESEATSQATKGKNQSNLVNPDGTVNTTAFKAASQPYKGQSSYK